ncbi:MAG: hypothetical protein P8184_16435 [Calditrichia bacterium]
MNSRKYLILSFGLFLLILSAGQANDQWDAFQKQSEKYYSYLNKNDVKNFTCMFTSSMYLNYIKQAGDSTYNYPLKFIWTRSGKIYFVLQPYPNMEGDATNQETLSRIQMLKKQFVGFYWDWQNYLLQSPFADIPDNAEVRFGKDSISVNYASGEGDLRTEVQKVFLPSGKLIMTSVRSKTETVLNYPVYTERDGLWVCEGWDSQIYKGGKISSGMASRLELNKIQGCWMPVRNEILVQSSEKPGEQFLSSIYLKDYLFNVPLQELESPDKQAQPKGNGK